MNFENLSDSEIYIDDCKENLSLDRTEQDTIFEEPDELIQSTLSWADMVEEELGDSIHDKILAGSLICSDNEDEEDEIFTTKRQVLNVNDILKIDDFNKIETCNLMENELQIVEDIKNILDSEKNAEAINNRIKWLIDVEKFFSKKLGLELFSHKNSSSKDKIIFRSSYKFCNNNFECDYNYNKRRHNGCYSQHYVHNMLYADLSTLINVDLKSEKILSEFNKSINTVIFVINHMLDELKNAKDRYFKNTHINKTFKKNTKKKILLNLNNN